MTSTSTTTSSGSEGGSRDCVGIQAIAVTWLTQNQSSVVVPYTSSSLGCPPEFVLIVDNSKGVCQTTLRMNESFPPLCVHRSMIERFASMDDPTTAAANNNTNHESLGDDSLFTAFLALSFIVFLILDFAFPMHQTYVFGAIRKSVANVDDTDHVVPKYLNYWSETYDIVAALNTMRVKQDWQLVLPQPLAPKFHGDRSSSSSSRDETVMQHLRSFLVPTNSSQSLQVDAQESSMIDFGEVEKKSLVFGASSVSSFDVFSSNGGGGTASSDWFLDEHATIMIITCFNTMRYQDAETNSTPQMLVISMKLFLAAVSRCLSRYPGVSKTLQITGPNVIVAWANVHDAARFGLQLQDQLQVRPYINHCNQSSVVLCQGNLYHGLLFGRTFALGECMQKATELVELSRSLLMYGGVGAVTVTSRVRDVLMQDRDVTSVSCLHIDRVCMNNDQLANEMEDLYEVLDARSQPSLGVVDVNEIANLFNSAYDSLLSEKYELGMSILQKLSEEHTSLPKPIQRHLPRLYKILSMYAKDQAGEHHSYQHPYRRNRLGWSCVEDPSRDEPLCDSILAYDDILVLGDSPLMSSHQAFPDVEVEAIRRQIETARLFRSSGSAASASTSNYATWEFQDTSGKFWAVGRHVIGKGYRSKVFLGIEQESGLLGAIKRLKPGKDAGALNSMLQEIKALVSLKHPSIVTMYGCGTIGQDVVIALEYVQGGTLNQLVTEFGCVPEASFRRYGRDILHGLAYLHNNGYAHLDIKPHNILITASGQCKLTDFGTAQLVNGPSGSTSNNQAMVEGSLWYMSPEQARGICGRECDMWAFGIVMLELVTGELPWRKLDQQMNAMDFLVNLGAGKLRPFVVDTVSPGLRYLIESCLKESPDERLTAIQALQHPFFSG